MIYRKYAGLLFVLATIVSAASPAVAQNAVLTVINNTSSYVTVSVDGLYGCNTADNSTCTIPVTVGDHDLRAVRSDTGEWIEQTHTVPEEGFVWTLSGG